MSAPPLELYTYAAEVLRWVDGDTLDLRTDLGHSVRIKQRYRLLASEGRGVDAPEKNATDPDVRLRAQAATTRGMDLAPVGSKVWIKTEQDRIDGFRRYLAQVWTLDGVNVGDALLTEGHAVPWVRR